MKSSSPKGKNKRCLDQLYVGGVPTRPGEILWVLRGTEVVRVRSRSQLSVFPERVLVTNHNHAPDAHLFDPDAALPSGVWSGFSDQSTAASPSQSRRAVLSAPTFSSHPDLTNRLAAPAGSSGPMVTVRPVLDLPTDEPTNKALGELTTAIRDAGGRALVVGGSVRDLLASKLTRKTFLAKDIDLEVYGLPPSVLYDLVASRYDVGVAGAAFAVIKASVGAKAEFDISLPRTESATGTGHRDFAVTADPYMSFAAAARRRDFTIGAMGFDPLTGELLDPYGGAADLAAGVLRHVSDAFDEDPLRALRAARFAARFDLQVHPDTMAKCRRLYQYAGTLAVERVFSELQATLLTAATPGVALHVLDQSDWIGLFPEVAALRHVPQSPTWHPEGDVLIHTAHVLDYFGTHLRTGNDEDDLVVALAALCHDLGKVATTEVAGSAIRAHGHEQAGVGPTKDLLRHFKQERLADAVYPLVAHHLAPVQLTADGPPSDRAMRRLATKVSRLDLLARVSRADVAGRPPLDPSESFRKIDSFEAAAARLNITTGPPARLALGSDLIDLGLVPGPLFKELLATAYDAQIEGQITTAADARAFLTDLAKSRGLL